MEQEIISKLFRLLLERTSNEETTNAIYKKLRECNKRNGTCCNACEKSHSIKCGTFNAMERHVRNGNDIDTNIALLIESNGIEFARILGATRVDCAEWLVARNDAHRKLTGENNFFYEVFAKELGVKL